MPRSNKPSTPKSQAQSRDSPYSRKHKKPTPQKPTHWHLQKKLYPNLGKPLSQKNYVGCDCKGTCSPATCACLRDGASCRQSCICGPTCVHQFPPCTCAKGQCSSTCPCYSFYHECTPACSCFSPAKAHGCIDTCKLPKTEIRTSGVPSAGFGLFAAQDIAKRQLIGVLEGVIEPNPEEPDFDVFEVAEGISLRCYKTGIYYANEKKAAKANAEYRYMEGRRRREMVLLAKRDIRDGEEIFAQYTAGDEPPLFDVEHPQKGSYALVLGEGDDGHEPWLGKILKVSDKGFTVQWLLRQSDVHYIPNTIRKTLHLKPGEHIMTVGWTDTLEWESFMRVVWVNEEEPHGEMMNTNTWWWTKTYDAVRRKMVKTRVEGDKKRESG